MTPHKVLVTAAVLMWVAVCISIGIGGGVIIAHFVVKFQ
jgi:hypothetical protein